MSFKDALKAAKLPERVVPVCLNLDLQRELELAERELADALRKPSDSLEGSGAAGIAERIHALEGRMREHTHDLRLRALPRPKWKALLAQHPPRKADDGSVLEADRFIGVNVETFFTAIVRACVIDPVLDDEDWALVDEKLTDAQFDALFAAAWSLNRSDVDVPFSRAASQILNSELESKRLNGSVSA